MYACPSPLLQGMVEAGDTVSATLKKEFGEEALNSLEATDQEKKEIEAHINKLFKEGDKVYGLCLVFAIIYRTVVSLLSQLLDYNCLL